MTSKEVKLNVEKLLCIAKEGNVEAVRSFLTVTGLDIKCINDYNETILMKAVADNDDVAINCLIAAGVEVDKRNKNGDTALMWAAFYGHVKCVNVLLRAGASKELTNSDGQSALMFCFSDAPHPVHNRNMKACVKVLIEAGVDVNSQNMEDDAHRIQQERRKYLQKFYLFCQESKTSSKIMTSSGNDTRYRAGKTWNEHDQEILN